jgi:hypothetical protein
MQGKHGKIKEKRKKEVKTKAEARKWSAEEMQ